MLCPTSLLCRRVIKRDLNPEWNERIELTGTYGDFLETGLMMQVCCACPSLIPRVITSSTPPFWPGTRRELAAERPVLTSTDQRPAHMPAAVPLFSELPRHDGHVRAAGV